MLERKKRRQEKHDTKIKEARSRNKLEREKKTLKDETRAWYHRQMVEVQCKRPEAEKRYWKENISDLENPILLTINHNGYNLHN